MAAGKIKARLLHSRLEGAMQQIFLLNRGPFYEWQDPTESSDSQSGAEVHHFLVAFSICARHRLKMECGCHAAGQSVVPPLKSFVKVISVEDMNTLAGQWYSSRLPDGLSGAFARCKSHIDKINANFNLEMVCYNDLVLHPIQCQAPVAAHPVTQKVSAAAHHRASGSSHQTVDIQTFSVGALLCRAIYAQLKGSGFLDAAPKDGTRSVWLSPDNFCRRYCKKIAERFAATFGRPTGQIQDIAKLQEMIMDLIEKHSNHMRANRVTGVLEPVTFSIPQLFLEATMKTKLCAGVLVMTEWKHRALPFLRSDVDGFR